MAPSPEFWDDFNQEYEDDPARTVVPLETVMAGACTVMAAAVGMDTPIGAHPALVFRFVDPTGKPLPPITLVGTDTMLRALTTVVEKAADGAIRATNEMRSNA